ncbi:MAG: helix-turn-helix domain-containing protein [Planctomycetes bacterium]|nr:helix-turn-helix domain-containing protein [Planctomycetota bacterium]
MEQKFVSFDDVIEKLGISAERLHELREAGQLRAYRDGKSWKFRTDEIAGMVEGGVPDAPPPSDIGLVSPADLVEAAPIDIADDDDFELSLVAEDDLEPTSQASEKADAEKSDPDLEMDLDDTDAVPGDSELEIAGLDDTVTTGGSDIALDLDLPEPGPSDSILLSEETLGESVSGSPSTIIGKDKIGAGDADLDLELALDDDDDDQVTAEKSDVKLSPASGASDVLSSGVVGSGVLDDLENASGGTSAFKDLDELEIDLAAESSPALSPKETGLSPEKIDQAKSAASSDLELADLELAGDDAGSTDTPVLKNDDGSGSSIDLAGDSDLLVSDAGGSDLTLESGDSGINLISASDSGLALDDIPLEMGGSAILSSLSLEGSDPEISLIASEVGSDAGSDDEPMAELQTDDDFQLTPLSEGADEEGDSSSQVIALDADIEDFSEGAAVLEDVDFTEEEGDVLSDDFAEAPAGDLDMGYAPAAAVATVGTPYSMLNILGLGSSALLLMLAGTMMLDMMRNIWSWDETYTLNSALMDAILGWF